jgi:hypothetical protein
MRKRIIKRWKSGCSMVVEVTGSFLNLARAYYSRGKLVSGTDRGSYG